MDVFHAALGWMPAMEMEEFRGRKDEVDLCVREWLGLLYLLMDWEQPKGTAPPDRAWEVLYALMIEAAGCGCQLATTELGRAFVMHAARVVESKDEQAVYECSGMAGQLYRVASVCRKGGKSEAAESVEGNARSILNLAYQKCLPSRETWKVAQGLAVANVGLGTAGTPLLISMSLRRFVDERDLAPAAGGIEALMKSIEDVRT